MNVPLNAQIVELAVKLYHGVDGFFPSLHRGRVELLLAPPLFPLVGSAALWAYFFFQGYLGNKWQAFPSPEMWFSEP